MPGFIPPPVPMPPPIIPRGGSFGQTPVPEWIAPFYVCLIIIEVIAVVAIIVMVVRWEISDWRRKRGK